jgi:C_GCAxxG_C_C family probable redox protein
LKIQGDNKEFIKKVRRKSTEYDKKHSGCSQSVLLSLQEEFEIGDKKSFKAATVLSGGIVRRGETCGALIGALMALGLVIGREEIENTEQYRNAMKPATEICERFMGALRVEFEFDKELKSTLCEEIQEKIYGRAFDLTDEKEYLEFLNAGGHSDQGCPKICGIASQIVAEKIFDLTRA